MVPLVEVELTHPDLVRDREPCALVGHFGSRSCQGRGYRNEGSGQVAVVPANGFARGLFGEPPQGVFDDSPGDRLPADAVDPVREVTLGDGTDVLHQLGLYGASPTGRPHVHMVDAARHAPVCGEGDPHHVVRQERRRNLARPGDVALGIAFDVDLVHVGPAVDQGDVDEGVDLDRRATVVVEDDNPPGSIVRRQQALRAEALRKLVFGPGCEPRRQAPRVSTQARRRTDTEGVPVLRVGVQCQLVGHPGLVEVAVLFEEDRRQVVAEGVVAVAIRLAVDDFELPQEEVQLADLDQGLLDHS